MCDWNVLHWPVEYRCTTTTGNLKQWILENWLVILRIPFYKADTWKGFHELSVVTYNKFYKQLMLWLLGSVIFDQVRQPYSPKMEEFFVCFLFCIATISQAQLLNRCISVQMYIFKMVHQFNLMSKASPWALWVLI